VLYCTVLLCIAPLLQMLAEEPEKFQTHFPSLTPLPSVLHTSEHTVLLYCLYFLLQMLAEEEPEEVPDALCHVPARRTWIPDSLEDMYAACHAAIRADPSPKPTEKKVPAVKKRSVLALCDPDPVTCPVTVPSRKGQWWGTDACEHPPGRGVVAFSLLCSVEEVCFYLTAFVVAAFSLSFWVVQLPDEEAHFRGEEGQPGEAPQRA